MRGLIVYIVFCLECIVWYFVYFFFMEFRGCMFFLVCFKFLFVNRVLLLFYGDDYDGLFVVDIILSFDFF